MTAEHYLDQFKADRKEALLSMDLEKVRAYMRKYGEEPTTDDRTLLIAVHKARTGCKDLPIDERLASKQWLTERFFSSQDDGDL